MTKRFLFATFTTGLVTGLLAACGDADTTTTATAASGERSSFELPNDHAIGSADAPVTIVEYASVVCGACANWSSTVYPELKSKYIDTGDVRFVFREFPTNPIQLFDAGVMIANCADDREPGAFFDSVKLQMERQSEILAYAAQDPAALRDQYIFLAKEGGMNAEEMEACLANEEIREEYQERTQTGYDIGISGTPNFLINGEYVKGIFTIEDFDAAIAEAKASAASG